MPKKTKNEKVFEIYRRKLSEHIVDVPDIYKIRKRPTADVQSLFSCWADFRQITQGFVMLTFVAYKHKRNHHNARYKQQ